MAYPHEFNLRGPWQYQVLAAARGSPASATGRIKLPDTWADTLGPDFLGRVRYTRSFAQPTNLEREDHVWLVLEGIDHAGEVALNGQNLGGLAGYACGASCDVTPLLKPRNELAVEVELADDPQHQLLRPGRHGRPGGLLGDVRLEVRRPFYLDPLAIAAYAEANGAESSGDKSAPAEILEIAGGVRGPAAGEDIDLAILVTAAQQEVLFEAVVPHERFHFTIPVLGLPAWTEGQPGPQGASPDEVEVSLVAGGVALWQTSRRVACRQGPGVSAAADLGQWPIAQFPDVPATVDVLRETLGTLLPRRIRSQRILPDDYYSAFDDCGLGVIQQMPAPWAAEVCPRLAHHPSIVAWQALPGDDVTVLASLALGRPWLAG